MIHLTYAIGQFFAIMLGAILHAVGAVLGVIVLAVLSIAVVLAGVRWLRRR